MASFREKLTQAAQDWLQSGKDPALVWPGYRGTLALGRQPTGAAMTALSHRNCSTIST